MSQRCPTCESAEAFICWDDEGEPLENEVECGHCGEHFDPEREPVRLGELFPDVTDELAEVSARQRVTDRHTTDEENDHG